MKIVYKPKKPLDKKESISACIQNLNLYTRKIVYKNENCIQIHPPFLGLYTKMKIVYTAKNTPHYSSVPPLPLA